MSRGNPYPNRYKDKRETTATPEEFRAWLNNAKILEEQRRNKPVYLNPSRDINLRALLSIMWYIGPRASEIVGDTPHRYETKQGSKQSAAINGLLKEDVSLFENELMIDYKQTRKHGTRGEPFFLPLELPGVDAIIEAWQKTEPGQRIFPLSKTHAWRLIQQITGLYPHYFRLHRATSFALDPRTSLLELQTWFRWARPSTAASYMAKGGRTTRKMSERLK
jgi:hypothetical protein